MEARKRSCHQCYLAGSTCHLLNHGCERCNTREQSCSHSSIIRFYATDFTFKHGPNYFEKLIDTESEDFGSTQNAGHPWLYYYVEDPWPTNTLPMNPPSCLPWSPLYYRKHLHAQEDTPYRYLPTFTGTNHILEDSYTQSTDRTIFDNHNKNGALPVGVVRELVVNCRRVCQLWGLLDMSNLSSQSRIPLSVFEMTGTFRITWRFQVYPCFESPGYQDKDSFLYKNPVRQYDITQVQWNPLGYPIWKENSDTPSMPKLPDLVLIAGIKRDTKPIIMVDEPGHIFDEFKDDFVLENVTQHDLRKHIGGTWFTFTMARPLVIGPKDVPAFAIRCMEISNWKGGFRFGGISLEQLSEPSEVALSTSKHEFGLLHMQDSQVYRIG